MLLRIAPLSLAYVPGRAIDVGPALDFTATRIRDTFSPIVQIVVLVAMVLWWRRAAERRRAVPPARDPTARAGPRGDDAGSRGRHAPRARPRARPVAFRPSLST